MPKITASTEIYGVFGNPVRHSKSPIIHNAWIDEFGFNAAYLAFEPSELDFEIALRGLIKSGLKGANFTTPFKEKAAQIANIKDRQVMATNAANTIKIEEDNICAYITDGAGLIFDLKKRGNGAFESAKTISVLGAGGAAKGLILELIKSGISNINIIARNPHKLTKLIDEISAFEPTQNLHPIVWNEMDKAFMDSQIIINATSIGLAGNGEIVCDLNNCDKETLIYDMIYHPNETKFLENARLCGLKTLNGIGMLVAQAALAFEIWFKQKPDFDSGLKRALSND